MAIREVKFESQDRRMKQILAALNENGIKDIEEAISYIKDAVLVELDEVSKDLVADLDSSIADAKQELEELKDKRKKTFLFINKFSGAI